VSFFLAPPWRTLQRSKSTRVLCSSLIPNSSLLFDFPPQLILPEYNSALIVKATPVSTPLRRRLSHGSRPPGRHPPHAFVTGQTIPARPRRRRIHRGGFIRRVNVLPKWKFQPLAKDDALSSSRARRDGRGDGRHERRRVRGFRETGSSVEEYYSQWQR